jgi:biofilm PGA synthesis N-glycosyltransferase PgaC
MKNNRNYLVISPCRNEASYARQTLDSVIAQTVKPAKWIIVDDGSTDETPGILAEYAAQHSWIEVITRKDRGRRAVGPGVIEAFYEGYDSEDLSDYEYLCKLDLDLRLPEQYFEKLIERMESDPLLGTCSGKSYIERSGKMVSEGKGDDTSLGMTKFYRLKCFQEIGGFVREVMWDGIDCHRCRMMGWRAESWDGEGLRFTHLRPMGSSQQNVLVGRMRHGYGQYFMGTGFLYMLASSVFRILEPPIIIGSIAMLSGWLSSMVKRRPRYADVAFRRFLRRYQRRVLLVGKRRAIAEIEESWES